MANSTDMNPSLKKFKCQTIWKVQYKKKRLEITHMKMVNRTVSAQGTYESWEFKLYYIRIIHSLLLCGKGLINRCLALGGNQS